jgi:aryl-alcohol dehydrogenase-like predicted oxidoreductase
MTGALAAAGAGVIASFCLAGGVLSGKYRSDPATGRQAGSLADPRLAPALRAADDLAALAGQLGTSPATLALLFPLTSTGVTSVLFGATSAAQVRENCAVIGLRDRIGAGDLARLRRIGQAGPG